MGIFDPSQYDPNTFAPTGPNFIDRLLASAGVQVPPSQGFPQSPMNANAAVPAPAPQPVQQPPQASPINIGGYSMPRIGAASDFTLPPGQLNPQTGEHDVVAPPQPVASAPAAAPANPLSNFFNHAAAGLHSIAQGGSVYGVVTGNPDDPRSLAQQAAKKEEQALLAAGLSPERAHLGAIDPEARKILLAQALGPQTVQSLGNGYIADKNGKVTRAYEPDDKNKIVKIGQDGLGREQYGVFNPSDGSIKPYQAPGADAGSGLGDMSKTGPEYLASLPPQQRGTVQAMIEGRMAPPSSFALSKPYWQNMIAAAQNVDPSFDATNWGGRVAGVKDFSAGKSSEMVRSANQTLHHVGQLLDSMDSLNNGSYPLLNRAGNAIAEATGGGAQGAFRTNAHAVAEELSKVFKGSNLSDAEIKAWEANLNENMSPEQQRAQVAKLKDLLQGSLQALDEKRTNSMGAAAAEKAGPLIKEEGQKVLQRIDQWTRKGTGAAQGAAPATTKSGVSWSVVQ